MNSVIEMIGEQSTTKSKFQWEFKSVLKSCHKKEDSLIQLAEKKASQVINAKITVVIIVDDSRCLW